MKHFYLLSIALVCSLLVKGQTFTIVQNVTGTTQNVFGQGFTPSSQGTGSGTVGSASMVGLYEFSFMLDASVTPDVLYIYEILPNSKELLIDGTGGTMVGQSKSKTTESYWYTNYQFDGLALDKNKMYFALFREAVNCEVGGGNYAGGDIYRLGNDGLMNTTEFLDTRFKASFAPPTSTNITNLNSSSILVHPTLTNGDVTITSEAPVTIDVYALTGVKLKTFGVDCGQSLISIADLPKGIYMFVSESKVICKVVKK